MIRICIFAALSLLLSTAGLAGADSKTVHRSTGLLIGDWQNDQAKMAVHVYADGTASVQTNVGGDPRAVETRTGRYATHRPGVWTITVKSPDHKLHVYSVVFDQSHRLMLTPLVGASLFFQRAGVTFDEVDQDKDGLISVAEASGTPIGTKYSEFVNAVSGQVDRRGYEEFLAKYPHIASRR